MNLDHELYTAISLALDAGGALRCYQACATEAQYKAHGELVTAADIEADSRIQAGLKAAFPKDAIFSEETPDSPGRLSNERVWIVDPLDSTSNFLEKGDEYCVSIGLSIHGRSILGVIYNPARDELFTGYEGRGVSLNGSPRSVSNTESLEDARLGVSRKEWRGSLNRMNITLPVTPIASMSYKLARVAGGMDDGTFSLKRRKEWGTCAGVALVTAAGGRATLLDGSEIRFNRRVLRQRSGMIAAGPALHQTLLESLSRLPASREDV
jgi:myo-inositol-1(or 4)-monophosphatase